MDKKLIRKEMLSKRNAMSDEEVTGKSLLIEERLYEMEEIQSADRIYIYSDINNEVRTKSMINTFLDEGKKVLLPKVYGRSMLFHEIKNLEELSEGEFHVLEPVNTVLDSVNSGVMIVPGVSFDLHCNRLGYGGGFYDRFLNANTNFIKIGIGYDFQLLDVIESEAFDIKMDTIVTNSYTITGGQG